MWLLIYFMYLEHDIKASASKSKELENCRIYKQINSLKSAGKSSFKHLKLEQWFQSWYIVI